MNFASGTMQIRRVTKIDSDGDTLMLDLLLVTPTYEDVWRTRYAVEWRDHMVSVVSRTSRISSDWKAKSEAGRLFT
jgi:hypothetical protein